MTYRYTVEAIDEMRDIVSGLLSAERDMAGRLVNQPEIEDRLRTYIAAGITLADLKAERTRQTEAQQERQRIKAEEEEAHRLRALSHWVNFNPYEPLPDQDDYTALIPFQEWARETGRVW